MGTFTVTTNSVTLFSTDGSFHSELCINSTSSPTKNTFTVSAKGVRSYCKYRWNFSQTIKIGFGNSAKAAKDNAKTFKVKAFNVHPKGGIQGWGPASGYLQNDSNGLEFSSNTLYTVSADSGGNCSKVYVYYNVYHSGVEDLTSNSGKVTVCNITNNSDITAKVQDAAGGAIDRRAPTITVKEKSVTSNSITFIASSYSNSTKSNWYVNTYQYSLDGGSWKTFHSGSTNKDIEYTVKGISSAIHKIKVRATRDHNNVRGTSSELSFDLLSPTFTSKPKVVATNNKEGTISFKCSHDCNCRVIRALEDTTDSRSSEVFQVDAGKTKSFPVKLNNIEEDPFAVKISRIGSPDLNNFHSQKVDTRIPDIWGFNITPTSSTKAKFEWASSYQVSYQLTNNSGVVKASGDNKNISKQVLSSTISIDPLTETGYTLTVSRLYGAGSKLQSTATLGAVATKPLITTKITSVTLERIEGYIDSDIACSKFYIEVSTEDGIHIPTLTPIQFPQGSFGISFSIDMTPFMHLSGKKLRIVTYAQGYAGNLFSEVISKVVDYGGFVYLYHKGKHVKTVPYLYTKSSTDNSFSWKKLAPYIYQEKAWKLSGGDKVE